MISPERGKISGADCNGNRRLCTPKLKKSWPIALVGMENPNHLLLLAHMRLGRFIRLTHLMTALNAFNNIDIIFAPHRQRILRLAGRTNRPGYKSFSH